MSEETGRKRPDAEAGKAPSPAPLPVRKGLGGILAGLAANLGLGRPEIPDRGPGEADESTKLSRERTKLSRERTDLSHERTDLSRERTDLSVERSYLASERTLMGWIRTALSMISFGFTIGKIGQAVKDVKTLGMFHRTVGVEGIAYFLVVLGTLSIAGAMIQHLIRTYELRLLGLRRRISLSVVVGLLLFLLGALALSALVLKL